MSRKEINIFGTSFLDLLSGALAAVIILFIIVPKASKEDMDLLKKVKEIENINMDIDDAIDRIKNGIPKEDYEKIEGEMIALKQLVDEQNKRLAELEGQIEQITDENSTLKEQIRVQQEEIEQMGKQLAEVKQKRKTANTVENALGVFAKFGILCRWNETDVDVDMGVQRFGANPEQCWRMYPSKQWGILGEDVRERIEESEEERFELFYVPQIYPDEYTIWINVYEKSIGATANVSCVFIFHPGKKDEIRQELPLTTISKGKSHCIATFRLSNNGFTIINHREPIWGNGKVIK